MCKETTQYRIYDIEGTGVGLYLVKEIIDYAEGKIAVESEFGKGTSFRVSLKLETGS